MMMKKKSSSACLVSSSSSPVFRLLLLLLIQVFVPSSAAEPPNVKVTDALLHQICSHVTESAFCFKVLKAHSASVDLRGLALISFDLTYASTSKTQTLLSGLVSSSSASTHAELKEVYETCLAKYNAAISHLNAAKQDIKLGKLGSVQDEGGDALFAIEDCGDAYEVPVSDPSPVRQNTRSLGILFQIFLAVFRQMDN